MWLKVLTKPESFSCSFTIHPRSPCLWLATNYEGCTQVYMFSCCFSIKLSFCVTCCSWQQLPGHGWQSCLLALNPHGTWLWSSGFEMQPAGSLECFCLPLPLHLRHSFLL